MYLGRLHYVLHFEFYRSIIYALFFSIYITISQRKLTDFKIVMRDDFVDLENEVRVNSIIKSISITGFVDHWYL